MGSLLGDFWLPLVLSFGIIIWVAGEYWDFVSQYSILSIIASWIAAWIVLFNLVALMISKVKTLISRRRF